MKTAKYVDDEGNTTLSFSSTIPGIVIIPPGKTIDDAIPITEEEFEYDRKEREAKNPKPRNLMAEIDELKKELASVKANAHKPE